MSKIFAISNFIPSIEPLDASVTSFGGQPVWLEEPQWPTRDGELIPFLGQIALEPQIFGDLKARVAYLFWRTFDGDVWSPDIDARAVVLQPGTFEWPFVKTSEGPIHLSYSSTGEQTGAQTFVLEGSYHQEPERIDAELRKGWSEAQSEAYHSAFAGGKIGGTPDHFNYEDCIDFDQRLVLQLDVNGDYGSNFELGLGGYSDYFYVSLAPDGLSAEISDL